MPKSKPKPCAIPGCNMLTHQRWCKRHKKENQWSKTAQAEKRGELYHTRQWRISRKTYLTNNPLCAECARQGRDTLAQEVDHIVPHRGDLERFWDTENFQGLCRPCHRSKTAKGL